MATTFGWLDLEFWWELAALVTIMLLGHWQEAKAVGQARGALAALAELLPDEAERVGDDGAIATVSLADLRLGDVVLVRSGARVPAEGVIVDGEAELDESMITGESQPVAKAAGDRTVAGTVSTDSAIRVRSTPWVTTRRWPASSVWWPRPRPAAAGPRCSPTGSRRCCSTSPPPPGWSPSWPGGAWVRSTAPWCAPSPCWSSPAPTPSAWRSPW